MFKNKLMWIPLISLGVVSVLQLQGCVAAAVPAAATGVAIANDRRSTGTIIDDQTIEVKALHAIHQKKHIWNKSNVSAVSYNNDLILVGQTPYENYRHEIEETVKEIPKVRKIYNEITIGQPISLAERSQDAWITAQIKTKMFGTKHFNPLRVKVITEDRVVFLIGITTHHEQITATEIAQAVPGVEKVVQIFEMS